MENEKLGFCEIFDRIENEFDEINQIVSQVEVMSDHKMYSFYLAKLKKLEVIANKNKQFKKLNSEIDELKNLSSEEFSLEIVELTQKSKNIFDEMKQLYHENQAKENEHAVIEINSKDDIELVNRLIDIFEKYSKNKNYSFEIIEKKDGSAKLKIKGENVYKNFARFSGKVKMVVQNKETFASIVVLKTEDNNFELMIDDLIIQTSKSSGAGGQHINKTESAVKIIHVPTGIFAECQDERSQLKNKERAMELLKKKITQKLTENSEKDIKNQRKEQNNKIFGTSPTFVIDFDFNKFIMTQEKFECRLKDIIEGDLDLIIQNSL